MLKIWRVMQYGPPLALIALYFAGISVSPGDVAFIMLGAYVSKRKADSISDLEICHANMAEHVRNGGLNRPAERTRIELYDRPRSGH